MIFINACSYEDYYIWQQEVLITNFRKFGISNQMQVIVWHPIGANLINWEPLKLKYPEVQFFFYSDKGANTFLYTSVVRPNALKQHFKVFSKELKGKVFFYHDVDIIFNYLPDLQQLANDTVCWQSNTTHYLDYGYLYRKQQQGKIPKNEAIKTLAKIGKIPVKTIKAYDDKTGGAQYILKGIDYRFWEEVERISLEIRKAFFYGVSNSINHRYFKSEAEGYQSWCADMWAVNFALWQRKLVTDVTPLLDFSWATDAEEEFHKKPIYHNAGVSPQIFDKSSYQTTSPIGQQIIISKEKASYHYVQAIKEVKLCH